jgi:spoIIIJ-associated protein
MKNRLTLTKEKLSELLSIMQIEHELSEADLSGNKIINVASNDGALLIGRGGENLRALEHVVNLLASRLSDEPVFINIDVSNYKKDKIDQLSQIALEAGAEAIEQSRAVFLKPMRANERRIVHTVLADNQEIITESQGVEPYRVVVVKKKS